MRIIYNDYIPLKGFGAMNVLGVLFVRKGFRITDRVINHEQIHTAQMRELLYIVFYVLYVQEWLARLVQYRNGKEAYRNISFEREAYSNEADMNYLKKRKHYVTFKYLKEHGKG